MDNLATRAARSVLRVERDDPITTVRCLECDGTFDSMESVADTRDAIRLGDFDAHPCVQRWLAEFASEVA